MEYLAARAFWFWQDNDANVDCKQLGIPVLKMDCGTVRDPEEWFGKRGASAVQRILSRHHS
jgi:hypothetical protein